MAVVEDGPAPEAGVSRSLGAGVAGLAGTAFGAAGEGFVRFSYANSVENIQKALTKMSALFA